MNYYYSFQEPILMKFDIMSILHNFFVLYDFQYCNQNKKQRFFFFERLSFPEL